MNSSHIRIRFHGTGLLAAGICLSLLLGSAASAAKPTKRQRPITKPKFDPDAETVELFAGLEKGQLEVQLIPKDAQQGSMLVENKTDKPLTVQVPEAFVGVQVLKQGYGGGGYGGGGYGGGGYGGGGYGGGGSQPVGGGYGGMMGGMGGMMGMGGGMGGLGGGAGFFSVPPERVVKVPYQSVCLEHGKAEPTPKTTYRLIKVEDFTKDPALQELIRIVGTSRRLHPQVAQAAAWHLTDKMSWRELATKRVERLGGQAPKPYFSGFELFHAQQLVAQAVERSREGVDQAPETERTLRRVPLRRTGLTR